MCVYIYIYIYTYIDTYVRTYILTYLPADIAALFSADCHLLRGSHWGLMFCCQPYHTSFRKYMVSK